MKVLQINAYGNYSTGKIAQNISKVCASNDIQSLFMYGRNSCSDEVSSIKFAKYHNCIIHYGFNRLFDSVGLHSSNDTKKLIKYIRDFKPDIIHLHLIHGYYLNYKILFNFLKTYDGKVVWTFHDCWAYTGHCAYYSLINCDKWKNNCYKCPQKMTYPRTILFSRSKRNYILKKQLFTSLSNLTIVTNCSWLKDEVKLSFFSKEDIRVIHNGIDLSIYKRTNSSIRQKLSLENKKILLGVANKWDIRKGLNDFIKLSKVLDDKFVFIIIGMTKQEEKLYDIPRNFIVLERTSSQKELVDYYSTADFFLNLTYEDTFPTTNLEAIACGCPVLTYDTGGCKEAVIDNVTGKVFKCGDVEGIVKFLNGNTIFDSNACILSSKRFDASKCYEKYIDLYKELIKIEKS